MIPDAEIIKVVNDILVALELGSPFTIKINSRKILDAMIEIAGGPASKFKTICSSIDKLDKVNCQGENYLLTKIKHFIPYL